MKHFLSWIKFILHVRNAFTLLRTRIEVLEKRPQAQPSNSRIDELEKAIADMQAAHSQDMQEIRERLEMGARRKPSGRPFSVLQKIASMGEAARAIKEQNV